MPSPDDDWFTQLDGSHSIYRHGTEIFNIFKASFQSTEQRSVRAAKIADDIRLMVSNAPDNEDLDDIFHQLWTILFEIVWLLPPKSELQDILADAMLNLEEQGGSVLGDHGDDCTPTWDEFWNLYIPFGDFWMDPTWGLEEKKKAPDPFKVESWQNLNSFIARIFANKSYPIPEFVLKHMRTAFEECYSEAHPDVAKCRLFVAHEYIMRCSGDLLTFLRGNAEAERANNWEPEDTAYLHRQYKGGPLCPNIHPFGFERWQFWKKRLGEIKLNLNELGLSDGPVGPWVEEMLVRLTEAEAEAEADTLDKWPIKFVPTEKGRMREQAQLAREARREARDERLAQEYEEEDNRKKQTAIQKADQEEGSESESEELKMVGGPAKDPTLVERIKAKIRKYFG